MLKRVIKNKTIKVDNFQFLFCILQHDSEKRKSKGYPTKDDQNDCNVKVLLYKFDGFRKIGFLDYSKDIWADRHAVQVKMNGIGKM